MSATDRLTSLDKNWSNYWSGRTGQESRAALVGIEEHPEINEMWLEKFAAFEKAIPVLDLCCGAGTVAKILNDAGFSNLTGADISAAAIELVKRDIPNITGIVTPADKMSFDDKVFDLVVSQYGFEYGDFNSVIPEVSRVLKPGGHFIALSHHTSSAIHIEVAGQLYEMKQIAESGFIDAGRALFTAAMTGRAKKSNAELSQDFRAAQLKLFPVAQAKRGLAEYLYVNTQKMYAQNQNYEHGEVMKWFDGIESDVDHFIGRMQSMHHSAINDSKLEDMLKVFSESGLKMQEMDTLSDSDEEILGWIFQGQKT